MDAQIGDKIIVCEYRTGEVEREGFVISVGAYGEPPYRIRWDNGHESMFYPGSNATVLHRTAV